MTSFFSAGSDSGLSVSIILSNFLSFMDGRSSAGGARQCPV